MKTEELIKTTNKELVIKALTELFGKKDPTAIDRYWGNPYIQHNPAVPDGGATLGGIVKTLGPDFKYEMGMIVADGDYVMAHGRYTGFGPKPIIAVDIFLVKNGKIMEHWDVLQEEIPADKTKSGHAMFTNPQNNN